MARQSLDVADKHGGIRTKLNIMTDEIYTSLTNIQGSVATMLGYWASTGYRGSAGYTGSAGAGYTGSAGYKGSAGDVGYKGSEGYAGSTGYKGSIGYQGSAGVGYTGSKGYSGSEGYTGSLGYTGSSGYTGSVGTSGGFQYKFSTTTTDADPGTGYIRFNNGTIGSVTQVFIYNTDINTINLVTEIDSWDDSTSGIKGTLIIATATNVCVFKLTSITTSSVYRKLTVTYISGTLPPNDSPISVTYIRMGDYGYTGSSGPGSTFMDYGSNTFYSGSTGCYVGDEFITSITKVDISPTAEKLGYWGVVSSTGSFTITSSDVEPSNVTFDWWALKSV